MAGGLEALYTAPDGFWRTTRAVQWSHFRALMDAGIPAKELTRDGLFTFGVVTIGGREMIVTTDPRLRSHLTGPAMFKIPGGQNG